VKDKKEFKQKEGEVVGKKVDKGGEEEKRIK
jgi:hypothetical protein